jgi:hypothetical protein
MSAVLFNLLSLPALDPITGLAGKAVGAKVVFSWSITETKLRMPPAPKASAKWSKGGPLASLVHVPWGARPWSNAGFIVLYIVFTAGCMQSTGSYLSGQGVNDPALAKQLLQWSQWFSLFGSIPLVCAANPGLMTAVLAITYGVSAVLLLIVREFLRPIMYLLMIAFALGTVGSTLASGLNGVPIFILIGPVIGAVTALRYLYQYRASFELQIAIYKEAIVASLVNPLLTFLVPVIEAAFQLYQFQLLAKVVLVHWTTPKGDDQQHKQLLLSALWFHQYWTVFTLRVVFEMVCASVIGKYYFRKAGASSANGVTRTLDAIANAFTKSLGTACFFGLVQFVVMALQRAHNSVSKKFHKTSWSNLPVKLVLFVMQFLLAVLISYVESLSGLSITYAGITGEGLCDSARRATDTMTTDGVQVLSESAGTAKLSSILVGLSITLSEGLLYLIWVPLTEFFKTDPSQLGTDQEVGGFSGIWGIFPVVFFCMFYINVSLVWVLERASKAVMLCALDECRHDRAKLTHAPPELKAMLRNYMQKKDMFPSMIKNFIVWALFCGAGYGLAMLQADEQIDAASATFGLTAAMVIAIVA